MKFIFFLDDTVKKAIYRSYRHVRYHCQSTDHFYSKWAVEVMSTKEQSLFVFEPCCPAHIALHTVLFALVILSK